jgi:predicted esterase
MVMQIKHHSDLGMSFSYIGEDLSHGPLPALFYFALSQDESLGLDPYNQPAAFLAQFPMRVFSLSLPFHGGEIPPTKALNFWSQEINSDHNIIEEFTQQVQQVCAYLIEKQAIFPDQVGVAGLSRGAFIACHVAAKIPHIQTILGFAPLTELSFAKEFESQSSHPLVKKLGLHNILDSLVGRSLRFYIGNMDTRVGTSLCFQFIHALAEASLQKGIRSSPVELIIGPSIGHQGHGTSKQVFEHGALWMAKKLGAAHD